jgi:hypothetical protein
MIQTAVKIYWGPVTTENFVKVNSIKILKAN